MLKQVNVYVMFFPENRSENYRSKTPGWAEQDS